MKQFPPVVRLVLLTLVALNGAARAQTIDHPYVGITHIVRRETAPRPHTINVIDIDLAAPGIRFKLTPPGGPHDTIKETTLGFLIHEHAQIAINIHFFEPWPPPTPDPGTADLIGIAASQGVVYSPFESHPPKSYAINPNAPGLNINSNNRAHIVHRNLSDPSGLTVAEPVRLWNTISGNEQILTNGRVTVANTSWNNTCNPRTAIGITTNQHLILITVDGRQPGLSEGLTVRELATLLQRDYAVTAALGLDGGGSTTLAIDTPSPHLVNTPADHPPRAVGSNLAVFAQPAPPRKHPHQ